ncbi:hypothetical protein D7316_04736 [Gordonia insulae]|uniref:Uncharacterized protein n=1 Tax=Gordonia insulae TaxID=2420509 RepID=A0A3G8JT84_9ACTN|nr:hypothetical protein D7316_04736 [Gordonia insulae]
MVTGLSGDDPGVHVDPVVAETAVHDDGAPRQVTSASVMRPVESRNDSAGPAESRSRGEPVTVTAMRSIRKSSERLAENAIAGVVVSISTSRR